MAIEDCLKSHTCIVPLTAGYIFDMFAFVGSFCEELYAQCNAYVVAKKKKV